MYKRQALLCLSFAACGAKQYPMQITVVNRSTYPITDLRISLISVSYTHLDVYKRQALISDLILTAEELGSIKRMHWSIENRLHHVLDDTFREDLSLIHI